jgi:hypothetical protein
MKRPQGADTLLTSLLLSPARSGALLCGMILGRSGTPPGGPNRDAALTAVPPKPHAPTAGLKEPAAGSHDATGVARHDRRDSYQKTDGLPPLKVPMN